jgi:hypothetical protein
VFCLRNYTKLSSEQIPKSKKKKVMFVSLEEAGSEQNKSAEESDIDVF